MVDEAWALLSFSPTRFGTETKGSALVEGANFYQCDLFFDLLKFGILRHLKTPYDYVGVLTPAMAVSPVLKEGLPPSATGDSEAVASLRASPEGLGLLSMPMLLPSESQTEATASMSTAWVSIISFRTGRW